MSALNEWKSEISAYLDGETENAAAVEALLRENPAAAQYAADLREVSRRVQALRPPEPDSEFVDRVMARLAPQSKRVHPLRHRVVAPFLAFAAAVLVISGAVWWLGAPETRLTPERTGFAAPPNRWHDDREVLIALEQLNLAGEDLSVFDVEAPPLDPESEERAAEDALEYLASLAWYDALGAADAIEAAPDVESDRFYEDLSSLQDGPKAGPRGGWTS